MSKSAQVSCALMVRVLGSRTANPYTMWVQSSGLMSAGWNFAWPGRYQAQLVK